MNLFDRRVIFVTGKGGVGKTSVCAALGLLAARTRQRVLICETSGTRHLPQLFGVPAKGYEPTRIARRLFSLSITPEEAIEDFVVQQIKLRRLYRLVFENRVMGPFVQAVPGLHDAVQVGKVFDLERQGRPDRPEWDLIIVDAPATGHALTMLSAPAAMMELTRGGPLHDNNELVRDLFDDPLRTALVLVALPEEMPVRETLDLWERLGARRHTVALCLLNGVAPPPEATASEVSQARDWLLERGHDGAVSEAAELAAEWCARRARQLDALATLERGLDVAVETLPALYRQRLGPAELEQLAEALAAVPGIEGEVAS